MWSTSSTRPCALTSDGSLYVRQGANSTPFYGEASIVQSLNWAVTAAFGIQQNSSTSYSFFLNTGATPGVGFFNVQSQSAFTYVGTTSASGPTGCYIYPTLLFQQGVSTEGEATFTADLLQAYAFRSLYNTFTFQNASLATIFYIASAGSTLSSPLTCSDDVTCGTAGSASTLTLVGGTSGHNFLRAAADNTVSINANNVAVFSCNGTLLNLPTDITSTTAAASKTFILESTNAVGTPAFVMKCRGTVQSTILQSNAFLTFAAQASTLSPRLDCVQWHFNHHGYDHFQ